MCSPEMGSKTIEIVTFVWPRKVADQNAGLVPSGELDS